MTVPQQVNGRDDASLKKSLIDSLAAYTSHLTADASLRFSHDLARRQLEHATAEVQSMESHFQKYPAIAERTKNDKARATEKVAKLDLQLKANVVLQSKLAISVSESIFSLFSRAEANLPEPHPDAVSREEYEGLQDRFQKQQDLLDQHQDRYEKQSSLIERLEKSVKEISDAAAQTSTVDRTLTGEITALKARTQKVELAEQSEKRSLRDLTATVSDHTSDIRQLKSDVTQNKSAQDQALGSVKSTANSATSSVTTLREDLGKIERHLRGEFKPIKNGVDQIFAEISEPGKESVLKRLKKHDQNINNLWTKFESSEKPIEPARIKLLEDRVGGLAEDLSKVKVDVKDPLSNAAATQDSVSTEVPHGSNSVAFREEVAHDTHQSLLAFKEEIVNDTHQSLLDLAEGFDNHGEHIKEHSAELATLSAKLEKLDQTQKDDFRQLGALHRASNDKHTSTNAACVSIEEKIASFTHKTDTLQSNFDSLSEIVKSLQKRPALSASPANGPNSQQFRPLPPPSPSVASPRTSATPGPAQINGFHPPNNMAATHNLTNGALGGPSNNRPVVTPDQIDGIWGSIQSLRQRFDNLTTEEVVKAMVDQASKMFPAAKEFQAAVSVLQQVDKDFASRLGTFETTLASLTHNMVVLGRDLKNHTTGQAAIQVQVSERLQKLRTDLTNAGTATAQLRSEINDKITTEAKKQVDAAMACQRDEIGKLSSKIEAFADVAFADD